MSIENLSREVQNGNEKLKDNREDSHKAQSLLKGNDSGPTGSSQTCSFTAAVCSTYIMDLFLPRLLAFKSAISAQ